MRKISFRIYSRMLKLITLSRRLSLQVRVEIFKITIFKLELMDNSYRTTTLFHWTSNNLFKSSRSVEQSTLYLGGKTGNRISNLT